MDIRQANPGDAEAIRQVAHRSLRQSYTEALDETAIETAVEQWYSLEDMDSWLADGDSLFLIVERDDDLVGFSQSEIIDGDPPVGRLHWVHVDPDHRGHGIGQRLLTRTEETLHARGVGHIEALVLEANQVGNEFYTDSGFEQLGSREVEIGDARFTENRYVKAAAVTPEDRRLDVRPLPDGREAYIDRDEPENGSKAPFFPVYLDADREDRYGLYCENCGSFDTAMDTMGRVECANCNNTRKPTRWDAAYL